MKQIIWIINCYLYGATVILLVVLALLVYLRGQANHLPNPFARRNIVYPFCLQYLLSRDAV